MNCSGFGALLLEMSHVNSMRVNHSRQYRSFYLLEVHDRYFKHNSTSNKITFVVSRTFLCKTGKIHVLIKILLSLAQASFIYHRQTTTTINDDITFVQKRRRCCCRRLKRMQFQTSYLLYRHTFTKMQFNIKLCVCLFNKRKVFVSKQQTNYCFILLHF